MSITLAEQCKEIRAYYACTQETLAKQVGTTQTEISFIEHGSIPLDPLKIENIQRLYKTMLTEANKT